MPFNQYSETEEFTTEGEAGESKANLTVDGYVLTTEVMENVSYDRKTSSSKKDRTILDTLQLATENFTILPNSRADGT